VGQQVDASADVSNTGTSDLPHAILDVSGFTDHWVLDNISSKAGSGQKSLIGEYLDFGPLSAGSSIHVTFSVTPKDAGNHDFYMTLWGDEKGKGVPSGKPLGSVRARVTVKP